LARTWRGASTSCRYAATIIYKRISSSFTL
jgi:hypothetical protein